MPEENNEDAVDNGVGPGDEFGEVAPEEEVAPEDEVTPEDMSGDELDGEVA